MICGSVIGPLAFSLKCIFIHNTYSLFKFYFIYLLHYYLYKSYMLYICYAYFVVIILFFGISVIIHYFFIFFLLPLSLLSDTNGIRLRMTWLWIRIQLLWLKLQILHLFWLSRSWHLGNYRIGIHSDTCTWYDNKSTHEHYC